MSLEDAARKIKEREAAEGKVDEVKPDGNEAVEKKDEAPEVDASKEQEKTPEAGGEQKIELTPELVSEFLENNEKYFLDYSGKKLEREITSFEDFVETRTEEKVIEKEPDLRDDVKAYQDYVTKTGRTFKDYIESQKDYDSMSDDSVLMEGMKQIDEYDADTAKEMYDLTYTMSEDDEDYTEKKARLASIRKKQDAKKYRDLLNKRKNEFNIPSKDLSLQREAEDKAEQERLNFANGMTSAINKFDSVQVGDFAYGVTDKQDVGERYLSVDGILSKYKTDDGLDFGGLLKTLYAGENVEAIAKAMADNALAKYIEEDAKEITHHKDKEIPQASDKSGSGLEHNVSNIKQALGID